jgi:Hemoglobin-like flavoprotein
MTNTEILLVQNSWKKLTGIQPQVIGDVFYSKLFLEAPYLKPIFKTSRPEQSTKLVAMLNIIVARLEHLSSLKNDIRELALRHQ